MNDAYIYKKGDVVKVYSLQSFHQGGFLDGEKGIVIQDQNGRSVLVAVKRNFDSVYKVDPSYEVYPQQLRLVKPASKNASILDRFTKLLDELTND